MPTGKQRRDLRQWVLPGALALAFAVLAVLAAVDHGSVALHLDRPITHWALTIGRPR